MRLRRLPAGPETDAAARKVLRRASYLNFAHSVTPGGFRYRKISWEMVSTSAVADRRRRGNRTAYCRVRVSGEFKSDMNWRRRASDRSPARATHYGRSGCSARQPKLGRLDDRALSMRSGVVATVYTHEASEKGRGGHAWWPASARRAVPKASRQGVNWKEFRAVERACNTWNLVRGKLVWSAWETAPLRCTQITDSGVPQA